MHIDFLNCLYKGKPFLILLLPPCSVAFAVAKHEDQWYPLDSFHISKYTHKQFNHGKGLTILEADRRWAEGLSRSTIQGNADRITLLFLCFVLFPYYTNGKASYSFPLPFSHSLSPTPSLPLPFTPQFDSSNDCEPFRTPCPSFGQ
jgi:hypothetical protein